MTSGPQPNLYAALNIRSAKTSRNISFARLYRRKLSPLSSAWRAEPDADMVSRPKHLNQPAAPSRFRAATPVASSGMQPHSAVRSEFESLVLNPLADPLPSRGL